MTDPRHVPVLLDRVVALLAPCPRAPRARSCVDATLGLGGHTEAVLDALPAGPGHRHRPRPARPRRWPASGWRRTATGSPSCTRCTTRSPTCSTSSASTAVDGVLFDLGVSSMQLDVRERGFAYAEDAPLDMRMDDTDRARPPPTCSTPTRPRSWPGSCASYGEEKFARRIAGAIVRRARDASRSPARRRLVELLYARDPGAGPAYRRTPRPSAPSRRCASRSTTSSRVLRRAIPAAIDAIGVGGRVVVESYHSLEDRLVKQAFADATRLDVPPDLPFVPEGHEPALRLVTRGAEQADERRDRREPARRLRPAARRRTRPHRSPHPPGARR